MRRPGVPWRRLGRRTSSDVQTETERAGGGEHEDGRDGAVAVIALLVVVLLAWIGGELHQRSCLAEVELKYPVAERRLDAERAAAADECSRWPF